MGEEPELNLKLEYTVPGSDNLSAGAYVQARFRCRNEIDWSAWSNHDYLLKAGVPERPPKLTYESSDATSITLRINPSLDSNGAPIELYKLFRDAGDNASEATTAISAYDGTSTTYQVTGLTSGKIYRFAV